MADLARLAVIVGVAVFTLLGLAFSIEMVTNLVGDARRRPSPSR